MEVSGAWFSPSIREGRRRSRCPGRCHHSGRGSAPGTSWDRTSRSWRGDGGEVLTRGLACVLGHSCSLPSVFGSALSRLCFQSANWPLDLDTKHTQRKKTKIPSHVSKSQSSSEFFPQLFHDFLVFGKVVVRSKRFLGQLHNFVVTA